MNPLQYHPMSGRSDSDRLALKFWCFDGDGGDGGASADSAAAMSPADVASMTAAAPSPAGTGIGNPGDGLTGGVSGTSPGGVAAGGGGAPGNGFGGPGGPAGGFGGVGIGSQAATFDPNAPAPTADFGKGVLSLAQGRLTPTSVFDSIMGLALAMAPGIGLGKGLSSLATSLGLEGKSDFASLGDAPSGGRGTSPASPSSPSPGGGATDTSVTVPGSSIAGPGVPSSVSGTGGGGSVTGGAAPSSVSGGSQSGFSDTVRRNLMLAMLGQGRVNG